MTLNAEPSTFAPEPEEVRLWENEVKQLINIVIPNTAETAQSGFDLMVLV